MRSFLHPFSLVLGLSLASVVVARADYNPVALTPSSFTQDIVVEKGASPPLQNFVNATMDTGTNVTGNTFFEQGFLPSTPQSGLPPHGTTFTPRTNFNGTVHQFKMPPDYTTNDAAFVGAANIVGSNPSLLVTQSMTATFTLNNPGTAYQALSVLWSSGGAGKVDVTVNHAGGSPEPLNLTTTDWFNNALGPAYLAMGRVQVDGTFNSPNTTTNCKVYLTDLTLVDQADPVTSVTFTYNGTGSSANYRFYAFALSGSTDGVNFSPIDVSGFNADCIVESNAQARAYFTQGFNVTMDGGPNWNGSSGGVPAALFEQGFATQIGETNVNIGIVGGSGATNGLPHPGTTITASGNANYSFQMPPSYATNDCVFIGNYGAGAVTNGVYSSPNYKAGSFNILNPQAYTGLSLMGSAGNGPAVINYTIYYSDGVSSDSGQLGVLDWFNTATATKVISAGGRVQVNVGPVPFLNLGGSAAGVLWFTNLTIAPAHQSLLATNVSFTYVSGGRAALFALSATTDGTHYSPIGVSGYDAQVIIAKEQPAFSGGLFTATSATMDNGTNNWANTWFERGWVTNGLGAGSGLPPASSIINSLADPTRHYQMPASYTGNNAVLIDTNHQVANITPLAPATYSAFALLSSGGTIGAGNTMSNLCILQHADGVNETNLFYGKDWFDNTVTTPAYISNGRCDTRSGSGTSITGTTNLNGLSFPTNVPNQDPRLFETFFQVNDTGSAVTNIQLQYKQAGGNSWTTYVLAVSATAGAVQPIVSSITQLSGPTLGYEGSNIIYVVSESGTQPIVNQWQFSSDGGVTWVNLADGGNVSGTQTLGYTNSFAGWTNTGLYRFVASNAAGTAITPTVSLNLLSGLPDVTQPGDPIFVFEPNGGVVPATEDATKAINDLVGSTNNPSDKYLNHGVNNGAPFVGPIGFVVSPREGKTTLSAMRLYTANDHAERDPIDYGLEGSNDGGNTWVPVASGSLALPATRNNQTNAVPVDPLAQVGAMQEVHFSNNAGYFGYRLSFTNAANNTTADSIQVGEVELLGFLTPTGAIITRDVAPNVRVVAGASPTFSIQAYGYPPPLFYQWYSNSVPILGATTASYTLNNVQASAAGSFYCVVSNAIPPAATSSTATLTVIAAPTGAYATTVMSDSPVAWYRLSEGPDDGTQGGNNGLTTYDSWGGHNGFYTNAILQQPEYSAQDTDPGSAYFGKSAGSYIPTGGMPDSCVEAIPGLDFAATNASAAVSVEAWVMLDPVFTPGGPVSGAGIVTKGYGGGGEQFALDCGGPALNGFTHTFRFYVRDAVAPGTSRNANGLVGPEPGVWHHVVGVLDDAHSNVVLYVDGLLNGSASTLTATNGLQDSAYPVVIGARQANVNTNNNLLFYGNIDEVAIYNHALSSNQVMNHFLAAGIAPRFTAQPTNTTINENASVCFYAPNYGSPTISLQWYRSIDGGGSFQLLPGETASTLCLSTVPGTASGYEYYLQAVNPYGTTNSATAFLTVVPGAPNPANCPTGTVLVYAGRSFSLASTFSGTLPISYQWFKDGIPLSNNGRVSGATSNVLAIANVLTNDIGSYLLQATNIYSGGSPSVCGPVPVYVETMPDFNPELPAFGTGWNFTSNTNSPFVGFGGTSGSGHQVTLTDGGGSEASSVWYQAPLYVGGFQARFGYQATNFSGSPAGADGMAFVLQNDPRGPTARGGAGGVLAYSGITPSIALTLNLYTNSSGGPGYSWGFNGAQGLPYHSASPVAPSSQNLINIGLSYNGSTLSLAMTDTVSQATFFTSTNVNIPALLGTNTAWVGFTGSDGGATSTQAIWDASYTPIPVLSAVPQGGGTILLSWPASVGGFALLQRASVSSGSWNASPATVNLVGNQYQALVSAGGGSEFYRLVLQPIEP